MSSGDVANREEAARELKRDLEDEPFRFDFFQAVRRLEALAADKPRVGFAERFHEDPIRFTQEASLAFAPSSVSGFEPGRDGVDKLAVRFLGLLGPNGPMPHHFSEYVLERLLHHKDRTLVGFLDVFHHRILALFYRAWLYGNQAACRDRPGEDSFARHVAGLIGIAIESYQRRDAVPDAAKLHYAHHLVSHTRNVEGLEQILADDLAVPARIEEFVGEWEEIPLEYRCRLGADPETGTLGVNAFAGSRYWDAQQKFRIVLGPMSVARYRYLLPGAPGWSRLRDWVRNYVGFELVWEVRLVLAAREVPDLELGGEGRLGQSTWLKSRMFARDAADLVVQGAGAARGAVGNGRSTTG